MSASVSSQILMDHRDHGCSLSNGASYPLDRACAHIASCKNTWHAGLEGAGRGRASHSGVRSGQDEAIGISRHSAAFEPSRFGVRTGEEKEVADLTVGLAAVTTIAPAGASQPAGSITSKRAELGMSK